MRAALFPVVILVVYALAPPAIAEAAWTDPAGDVMVDIFEPHVAPFPCAKTDLLELRILSYENVRDAQLVLANLSASCPNEHAYQSYSYELRLESNGHAYTYLIAIRDTDVITATLVTSGWIIVIAVEVDFVNSTITIPLLDWPLPYTWLSAKALKHQCTDNSCTSYTLTTDSGDRLPDLGYLTYNG